MTGAVVVSALLDAKAPDPKEFMAYYASVSPVGFSFKSIYDDDDYRTDHGTNTFIVHEVYMDGKKVYLGVIHVEYDSWYTASRASNEALGRKTNQCSYHTGPFGTKEEAAEVLKDGYDKP